MNSELDERQKLFGESHSDARSDDHSLQSKFEPIAPSRLNDDIYNALCIALRDGRLLPGQRISIRDLSAAMGTSAMPVREALRRLETQGVLDFLPGRMVRVPGLTAKDIEEIYRIRIELESLAAEVAAERRSERDVEMVEGVCRSMQAGFEAGDYKRYMENNYQFHMGIYRCAGMPMLLKIIEPLWLRVSPFLWSTIERNLLQFSMDQHWRALEGLSTQNSKLLREAIAADLQESQSKLRHILIG